MQKLYRICVRETNKEKDPLLSRWVGVWSGLPALGAVVFFLGLAPRVVLPGELHLEMHKGGDGYTIWVNLGGTGHAESFGNEAAK